MKKVTLQAYCDIDYQQHDQAMILATVEVPIRLGDQTGALDACDACDELVVKTLAALLPRAP